MSFPEGPALYLSFLLVGRCNSAFGLLDLCRGPEETEGRSETWTPAKQLADERQAMMMKMARPERFELPTFWFVARRSIQLS